MRTDFAKDDAAQIALNVPSNRLVTGGYGKPVKRPKDIGDLAAEAEKIAERDN